MSLSSGQVEFLKEQRWFQHKGEKLISAELHDSITLPGDVKLGIFKFHAQGAEPFHYLLPISCDASTFKLEADPGIASALFALFAKGGQTRTPHGSLSVETISYEKFGAEKATFTDISANSSNSLYTMNYDERPKCVIKLIRRLFEGQSVEASVNRHLFTKTAFKNSPTFLGSAYYRSDDGSVFHLANAFDYCAHDGAMWEWTQAWLLRFIDEGLSLRRPLAKDYGLKAIETYSGIISRMGEALALLHAALAVRDGESFGMKRIEARDIEAMQSSWLKQLDRAINLAIESQAKSAELSAVIENEGGIREAFLLAGSHLPHLRWKIRQHGDFHLGQVLIRDGELCIIDYEGEPLKAYSERGDYYPALKDVSGMLRSLNYASFAAYFAARERHGEIVDEMNILKTCRRWEKIAADAFLGGYYKQLGRERATFLPLSQMHHIENVLTALKLEKALYELEYELGNRPTWLAIPANGINELLEREYESDNLH